VEEMSIGEFARRSRLSPKALRLYDGLGLLSPARVDELSGYRYYEDAQLEQARLIATLRHVGVPLTTVKELLELDQVELAERVTAFWREAETRHAGQRELVTARLKCWQPAEDDAPQVVPERLPGPADAVYTSARAFRRICCYARVGMCKRNVRSRAAGISDPSRPASTTRG
jgi:DNA-binding transcriptional MerR regulator